MLTLYEQLLLVWHVCTQALPCVHTNLEDYTTDNRGDVGSWVREAAMDVLEVWSILYNLTYVVDRFWSLHS